VQIVVIKFVWYSSCSSREFVKYWKQKLLKHQSFARYAKLWKYPNKNDTNYQYA